MTMKENEGKHSYFYGKETKCVKIRTFRREKDEEERKISAMNDPFFRQNERYFTINIPPFSTSKSLVAGMTTRQGGKGTPPFYSFNMASYTGDDETIVYENRKLLASDISFPLSQWRGATQVHGRRLMKVTSDQRSDDRLGLKMIGEADGLYTTEKNILLVSFYADCVPLFIYVPSRELIGLLHAGWKGTAEQIGPKSIAILRKEERIDPSEVHVVIGPAISHKVYEVDDTVIQKMKAILPPGARAPWTKTRDSHYLLDLKEMNRLLFLSSGVKKENMAVSQYCTYSEKETFFSYRRDQGHTGRMMTFIGWKDC